MYYVNPKNGNLYQLHGEPIDGVQRYFVWTYWASNPPTLYKQYPKNPAKTYFELLAGSHIGWETKELVVTREVTQPSGRVEKLTYHPIYAHGLSVGAIN